MTPDCCKLPPPPSARDARQSLNAAAAAVGAGIYERYGPRIGWTQLVQILKDRACVRYPCEIVFDATPLQEGELAHPVAKGDRPEDGFRMYVHPFFMAQLDQVPLLVLYQLVLVNYGAFAAAEDAETFGAAALGLGREEYYQALCRLADSGAGVLACESAGASRLGSGGETPPERAGEDACATALSMTRAGSKQMIFGL